MRRYELMLILRPDVADSRAKEIFERTTRSVTEQGGTILKDVAWGRRRMAYEINHKAEGIYAVLNVTATKESVAELDRQLNLNEAVMRTKVMRPAGAK